MSKKKNTPVVEAPLASAEVPVTPVASAVPEPTGPIKLTEAQAAEVVAAEKSVVDMKCRLANLVIQQLQASQDTVRSEQGLIDKISEFARTNGITPENAARWTFDTKTMTFSRSQ